MLIINTPPNTKTTNTPDPAKTNTSDTPSSSLAVPKPPTLFKYFVLRLSSAVTIINSVIHIVLPLKTSFRMDSDTCSFGVMVIWMVEVRPRTSSNGIYCVWYPLNVEAKVSLVEFTYTVESLFPRIRISIRRGDGRPTDSGIQGIVIP
ncbi:hypothetical protein BDR05DRAFT_952822 [Suillus weaverae]|nr:hypothetical protein BDR05DRAFT_952822 [Suillus weaverae]